MPETRRTTNTTKAQKANLKKEITSKERAQLRSQAQSLSAVVMVGHDGITEGVIASKTRSLLVSVTGFTAVFYRKTLEANKR